MKNYFVKMVVFVLIISSFINIYKEEIEKKNLIENTVINEISYNSYRKIVYDDLTLEELENKIDNMLSSTLSGYGSIIASKAIAANVDPVVATSIIFVETGCKWNCSNLVKKCNNVGGMKGKGCGSYAKFDSLDAGIDAFISNLANNYYSRGLNTPELMNKKYAENPNWAKDVNYYVRLIKAS